MHALMPACCGSFLQPSASAHLRTRVLRFVFAAFCTCRPPGTGEVKHGPRDACAVRSSKCASYVDPERYPERNLNDTLNDTPCVAWKAKSPPNLPAGLPRKWLASHQWHHSKQHIKTNSHFPCTRSILQAAAQETHPVISHAHARFCKRPLKKHVSGIAANIKSKPAIPHADARFCKQPLKKHISGKHARGSRLTRFSRIPHCTLDLGRLGAWTLQETNTADHHLGSLFPHVHTETQRSFPRRSGAATNKTQRLKQLGVRARWCKVKVNRVDPRRGKPGQPAVQLRLQRHGAEQQW